MSGPTRGNCPKKAGYSNDNRTKPKTERKIMTAKKTVKAPAAKPAAKAPAQAKKSAILGKTELVAPGSLKPWDGNPRKHLGDAEDVPTKSVKLWDGNPRENDGAVLRLAELIREHGQRSPLVVDRKTRTIYKGNTTWKAIRALGWDTVAVVFADFPSDQAAIAYAIADNKASEWSDWDDDALTKLLRAGETFYQRKNTGFLEKELASMRLRVEQPEKTERGAATAGTVPEAEGHFVILHFDTAEEMAGFKKRFNVGKDERVAVWSAIKGALK